MVVMGGLEPPTPALSRSALAVKEISNPINKPSNEKSSFLFMVVILSFRYEG